VESYTRRDLLVALSAAAGIGAGEVPVLWHIEAQVEVYRQHGPECHDSALTVLHQGLKVLSVQVEARVECRMR
jgi:hypothetical protein